MRVEARDGYPDGQGRRGIGVSEWVRTDLGIDRKLWIRAGEVESFAGGCGSDRQAVAAPISLNELPRKDFA